MLETQRFLFAPAQEYPGFAEAMWADALPKLIQARLGAHLTGDPREVALREAVTSCVRGAARAFGRTFRSRDVERQES
jgi:metal-dependent amidase/aminoacylase/carboxypeptidase family protein